MARSPHWLGFDFGAPGGRAMPGRIRECRALSNRPPREARGQTARAVYESPALKYRRAVRRPERDILGRDVGCPHIAGGGSRNAPPKRMAASAAGRPGRGGGRRKPAGAGYGAGEPGPHAELRAGVRASCETAGYLPPQPCQWDEAYGRFFDVTGLRG